MSNFIIDEKKLLVGEVDDVPALYLYTTPYSFGIVLGHWNGNLLHDGHYYTTGLVMFLGVVDPDDSLFRMCI
jgi:hypothetical protein